MKLGKKLLSNIISLIMIFNIFVTTQVKAVE